MADGGGEGVDLGIPGLGPAELVGRGGFGLVYRAIQLSSGGAVAVKLVQGHLDRSASVRFEREASALGALRGHPNICTVYDAGVDADGRPYLVMELATSSLAERIASHGPLPWEEAVALGVRLAGALETAHRSLLLHRDVKPENVLLTSYGEWRLADFGLAQLTEDTVEDNLAATPSHAAPELIGGAPPSAASDIYALGSTLFVALTGAPAFARGDGAHVVSVYKRIAEDPVPDLPGIPQDVAHVVRTAMAKAPGDRFATAADLGAALQRAQQSAGVAVTPLLLPSGETVPPPEAPSDGDLTIDGRTPVQLGALTEAVNRSGRRAPAPEEPPPDEPAPSARPSRRVLFTTAALALVVLVIVAALAVGDDEPEERATDGGGATTPPTSPNVRLAAEWEQEDLYIVECEGDDEGPCPDTSAFELDFTVACPAMPAAGGFGRSPMRGADDGCTIALLGLPPVEMIVPSLPLEEGAGFSAQVETDSPPGGLVMELGPTCAGERTNLAISFSPFDEGQREGERVITEVRGDLYVYPLSVQVDPTCGSQYHFGFTMRAAS